PRTTAFPFAARKILHVIRLQVIRPESIHGDLIGDNIFIAVSNVAKLGDLAVRDRHANTVIAVTNIEVPNTRRKLLKIKLRSNVRAINGHIVLTANSLENVSVRRLDEREVKRSTGVGLEVLNDPPTPSLNLVRRLLVRFGESILRNEPIISERRIKCGIRVRRKRSAERCGRNTTANTGIRLTNVHISCISHALLLKVKEFLVASAIEQMLDSGRFSTDRPGKTRDDQPTLIYGPSHRAGIVRTREPT